MLRLALGLGLCTVAIFWTAPAGATSLVQFTGGLLGVFDINGNLCPASDAANCPLAAAGLFTVDDPTTPQPAFEGDPYTGAFTYAPESTIGNDGANAFDGTVHFDTTTNFTSVVRPFGRAPFVFDFNRCSTLVRNNNTTRFPGSSFDSVENINLESITTGDGVGRTAVSARAHRRASHSSKAVSPLLRRYRLGQATRGLPPPSIFLARFPISTRTLTTASF